MKNPIHGGKYPLHPALVHIPIGLFPLSLLLDLASWIWPAEVLTRGAFYAMAAGVAGALLAAIPGMLDYADIRDDHPAKRTATYHMALNLAAVALYAVNLGLRYSHLDATQTPVAPLWMSVAAVLMISVSGYLGGVLVYDDGIGVGWHRREADVPEQTLAATAEPGRDGLVAVANDNALPEGHTIRVDVHGQVVCVARSQGRLYAFQEFCTHRYGPLSEGAICENRVQCPWHRSEFDMETGRVLHGPAKVDLKTFKVEVRDGQICVAAPPPAEAHADNRDMAA